MTCAVETEGLACRYPGTDRPALEDVSIRLARGSLTVVMGATGAGKSTLLCCVARLVPAFTPAAVRGVIRVLGQGIETRTTGELAGTIGMVFQDFEAQLFSTDVTQEVVFGLEQIGVAAQAMPERVRRALGTVGLAGFEGRDPTTLSGGEKQRLAIAGLLALEPEILMLDEPTTDLDPVGRHDVLALLDRMAAGGRTVVLVEHEPSAAERADQVIVLAEGRVVAAGPPQRVPADVAGCEAAGIPAPDTARVFAALGIPDPPLDVAAGAEGLRAAGLTLVAPPADPPRPCGRAYVQVERVAHRYASGQTALDGVTTTLGLGEMVAVVGRNGSGKTTLAKHLNGLLLPSAGRVTVDGHDVRELALETTARHVGYVFQDPDHQLFAATVVDEVAFGPRNLGCPPPEVTRRVDAALAAVGLVERDVDPFVLDKGARQRLAVAAVLAMEPPVLVLDEPTTGLDRREQRRMLELLRTLSRAGRTIVLITHTPWVIAEYAERVLLLSRGRLRYDGPVRPFFADPALVAEASFRAPDVTRLGQCFGCTPLSVEELVGWVRPEAGS